VEYCPIGWKRAHQFEPRYDESAPDLTRFDSFKMADARALEFLRAKTYVRDVCVRCGKTIERTK
jgi:hypothetical protein